MEVRAITWHDLPAVFRNRNRLLFLDSIYSLTQGSPVSAAAVFSFLRMEYSTYTGVARSARGAQRLIGQVHFNPGEQAARLSFITPNDDIEDASLSSLLDHLAYHSGDRGFLRLLAELDESDPRFECLRHSAFSVYTRQHIWKLSVPAASDGDHKNTWVPYQNTSQHALHGLYHAVVPPLVQGAEAMDKRHVHGFCFYRQDELLAFVEVIYGPVGIYLIPTVHPNFRDPARRLQELIRQIPTTLGRPVYIAVRDYQSWLNNAVEDLNGQSSSRKVLLVKHLVRQQRVAVPTSIRKVLESHTTEPTAPIVNRSQLDRNNGAKP